MERMTDTDLYVQEGLSSNDDTQGLDTDNCTSEQNMKGMKRRLKKLESEVGSLRAELRLIKRKFRDVDPYQDKYREIIEKIVADTLDHQRCWRLVPVERAPSSSSSTKRTATAAVSSSNVPRRHRSTPRFTFNQMGNDSNSDEDMDPLEVSLDICTDFDDDIPSTSQPRRGGTNVSSSGTKDVLLKSLKSTEKGQVKRSGITRGSNLAVKNLDPQVKIQICERAKVVGPTAAGREYGLSESTVRCWLRKLREHPHAENERNETLDDIGNCDQGDVNEESTLTSGPFQRRRAPRRMRNYKQYVSTPELKWKACKRAREVGSTKAGREFNIPEGSIRHWMKVLAREELLPETANNESHFDDGQGEGRLKFETIFSQGTDSRPPSEIRDST